MNNGKASRSSGCVYNPDGYTLIINNNSLRIDENDSPYKMNLRNEKRQLESKVELAERGTAVEETRIYFAKQLNRTDSA